MCLLWVCLQDNNRRGCFPTLLWQRARTSQLTATLRSPAAKANRRSVVSCCGSPCYMIFTHVAQDRARLDCEWIRENQPVALKWRKKRRTGWSRRRSCVYGPGGKIGRCSCFTNPRKSTRAPGPEVNLASSYSAVPLVSSLTRRLGVLGWYIICSSRFTSPSQTRFGGFFGALFWYSAMQFRLMFLSNGKTGPSPS